MNLNLKRMAKINKKKKPAEFYLIFIIPAIITFGLYLKGVVGVSESSSTNFDKELKTYNDLITWADENVIDVYCGLHKEASSYNNEDKRHYKRLEASYFWESSGYPDVRSIVINNDLPKEYEKRICDYILSEFDKCRD
tara:strand:- start:1432 stop:1845 length:414 start_codon:yes stop_codon:yes gene_type:complete